MGRADYLYSGFLSKFQYEPTVCQDGLLRYVADFISSDEDDILVVNGYAGTGKTTAISAVISVLKDYQTKCVLLAPTGRAAKVLSSYAGQPAFTVHKHIYRQKSAGGDGFGQFSLLMNKDKETVLVVHEVSLMAIDAGQMEAGRSIGMSYGQTMWHIIAPQVIKNVLPTLCNEFITLIKETSIAFNLGVSELTNAGDRIRGQTYSPFMPLIAVALIYLVIVVILTKLVGILERRLRQSDAR